MVIINPYGSYDRLKEYENTRQIFSLRAPLFGSEGLFFFLLFLTKHRDININNEQPIKG